LLQKVSQILKHYKVEGLLDYHYDYQVPTRHCRGRYQITSIISNQPAITALEAELGWRAYVTNAPAQRLTLSQGVLTYRDEWIIEHSFHRLKGVPLSLSPFFVQRDDQVKGLVHLLSLALRLLTLIEFRVRRFLRTSGEVLVGLYEGSPKKATQRPTTEKLLAVFKNINLTLVRVNQESFLNVTELNPLQKKILVCLGFSPCIYSELGNNSS
jgi:transposase